MNSSLIQRFNSAICRSIGHRWRYKDYSNYMKANGDVYDFTASRHCTRCGQYAYYFSEWVSSEKSILDFEGDFNSTKYPVNI